MRSIIFWPIPSGKQVRSNPRFRSAAHFATSGPLGRFEPLRNDRRFQKLTVSSRPKTASDGGKTVCQCRVGVLFSGVTYTTLGYCDPLLPNEWRLLLRHLDIRHSSLSLLDEVSH